MDESGRLPARQQNVSLEKTYRKQINITVCVIDKQADKKKNDLSEMIWSYWGCV